MSDKNLAAHLAEIVGPENFFSSPADLVAYSFCSSFDGAEPGRALPLACARPRHGGQLERLVNFCAREGIPIAIRGGGSSLRRPSLASSPLVILTAGLNRILDLDAGNRTALVQCGVTVDQLGIAAHEEKLFYPPASSPRGISTLGGALAMNSDGPRSLKYGAPSGYVLSLDVLTASGETLHICALNEMPGKIAPGFPLAGIFCGSAGALGIISQASVRLLPAPEASESLAWTFPDLLCAAHAPSAILAAGITPASMDFMDATCGEAIGFSGNVLWLELDGHPAEVAENLDKCRQILSSLAADGEMDAMEREKFQKSRPGLIAALFARIGVFQLETARLPPARLPAFLENISRMETRLGMAVFGFPGIASMSIACFAQKNSPEYAEIAKELFTLELVLNNAMRNEDEAALSREKWRKRALNVAEISSKLRGVFDPGGLFSPQALPDDF